MTGLEGCFGEGWSDAFGLPPLPVAGGGVSRWESTTLSGMNVSVLGGCERWEGNLQGRS